MKANSKKQRQSNTDNKGAHKMGLNISKSMKIFYLHICKYTANYNLH